MQARELFQDKNHVFALQMIDNSKIIYTFLYTHNTRSSAYKKQSFYYDEVKKERKTITVNSSYANTHIISKEVWKILLLKETNDYYYFLGFLFLF